MESQTIAEKAHKFWSEDFLTIESRSIKIPITQLKQSVIDYNVPPQGSVLMGRVVNVDSFVKPPSVLDKFIFFLGR